MSEPSVPRRRTRGNRALLDGWIPSLPPYGVVAQKVRAHRPRSRVGGCVDRSVGSPVRLRPASRTIGQDVVNRAPHRSHTGPGRAMRPGTVAVPAQRYGAGVRRASCGSQARDAPIACGPPTPGGSSAVRSLADPDPPGPRRGDRGVGHPEQGRFPPEPGPAGPVEDVPSACRLPPARGLGKSDPAQLAGAGSDTRRGSSIGRAPDEECCGFESRSRHAKGDRRPLREFAPR